MDSHRHALGQANPLEGRADIRQQVEAGAAVFLGDAPAQAVDTARQRFVWVGHQGDDGPVAAANILNVVFPEIPDHPVAVDIHQRKGRLVFNSLAAQSQFKIGHIAVHRCPDFGELPVELGLADGCPGRAQFRIPFTGRTEIGPRLGQIGFGLTQVGLHLLQLRLGVGFLVQIRYVIGLGLLNHPFGGRPLFVKLLLAIVFL